MKAKGKIQAQLSAYLDGELDETQLRQVEEALENDGGLRVELAQLSAARNLLRDLPSEKPPVDLVSRILAEAERNQLVSGQHGESSSNPLRWVRYVASAAVLLMAATVGMIIAVTLCSPGTYQEHLARTPAPAWNDPHGKNNIAIASGDDSRDTYVGIPGGSSGAIDRSGGSGVRAGRSGGSAFDDNGGAIAKNNLPVVSGKGGGGDRSSGIANNVDRITAVLAGNLTNNEIIYSDRLDDTQKHIEGILTANGIAPVVTKKLEPTSDLAKQAPELPLARANFYFANRLSSEQVQYEAYVTPKQMEKVQEELGRLRAKQNVSQDTTVLALAKADAPMKDGGWNFEGRPRSKSGYHYKGQYSSTGGGVGDEAKLCAKARAATVAAGTENGKKKFATKTAEAEAVQEERPSARVADAAEGDVKIARAPAAAARPPAQTVTPVPAAEPAMPAAPTTPEPAMPAEAPVADDSLAKKPKLGDSRQVKDDVGGAAKEINGSEMAQHKIAETSTAAQAEMKDPPAVAAIDEPDLLGRRQTLKTRFGAETVAPSTRPAEPVAGQVAGPVGGQIAAGTPNVRVTPPACGQDTPKQDADADKDTTPVVQVTLVDGKTMQAGEKITIELDRQGQARNTKWSTTHQSTTHGLGITTGLAKAEQSLANQLGSLRESAGQATPPGLSQRGVPVNSPAGQQSTTRVQRLLITLNYRHVDQANKASDPAASGIRARPTSQAATSQIERAEKRATQQPEQE